MLDIFQTEKMLCANRIKHALHIRNMKQTELCRLTGIPKSAMSQYLSGAFKPKQDRVYLISEALDVSEAWLMGYDVPMERGKERSADKIIDIATKQTISPGITEDFATFPVIGDIAAGFDHIAYEDWEGDKVDVPLSYLKGHNKNDFFVLRVTGNSMYPFYLNGDKVLILKQPVVNNSGDVAAVIYDGEFGTLKKVEFSQNESWVKLVPINPSYEPIIIENDRLQSLTILGIPKLLIREFN